MVNQNGMLSFELISNDSYTITGLSPLNCANYICVIGDSMYSV